MLLIGITLWTLRYLFKPIQYNFTVSDEYQNLANRSVKALWVLQFSLFSHHIIPTFILFDNWDMVMTGERILAILPLIPIIILLNTKNNQALKLLSLVSLIIPFYYPKLTTLNNYPKLTTLNSVGAAINIFIAIWGRYLSINYTPLFIGFLYIAFWTFGWTDINHLPPYPSIWINLLFATLFIIFGYWYRQFWIIFAVSILAIWKSRNIIYYIFNKILVFIKFIIEIISNLISGIFNFISKILGGIWDIISIIVIETINFSIKLFYEFIRLFSSLDSLSEISYGIILLAVGFIMLGAGVYINLKQSNRDKKLLEKDQLISN